MMIFTDGSKSDQGTGSALYVPEQNIRKSIKRNEYCSIFSAELVAIRQALIEISMTQNRTIIFTDSLSALQSIINNSININQSWFTINIKYWLYKLTVNQNNNIKLVRIPSHKGITENETVDLLAKEAAKLPTPSNITTPIADITKYNINQIFIPNNNPTNNNITKDQNYNKTPMVQK